MAFMDDAKDDMGNMRDRYDKLRQMEEDGTLDDKGRQEMESLRGQIFGDNV
jgi:hypothetical protein